MKNEILEIKNVSKKYRLGMIGGTTLRDEIQRKIAVRKGLEDPTSTVGSKSIGKAGEEFLAPNGFVEIGGGDHRTAVFQHEL